MRRMAGNLQALATGHGKSHLRYVLNKSMKIMSTRTLRTAGLLSAAAFALSVQIPDGLAQGNYPNRPVRWIVPVAPGGTLDIVARLMGQRLSERFGQPFIIDNRPGGGANIGTEVVVRAPADGYTLLLVPSSSSINATLYEKLNFNFIREIAPVASISRVPLVMVVNPSLPARTVPEFIAYARTHRGKLSMASGGNGSTAHMAGELLKMMADIDMVHVPYRGGAPALIDLIGGQVQVAFSPVPDAIEHVKAGKLRPLGVTTAKRTEALPEVSTVGEFVPGYEASTWNGMGAPRNTPAGIIDKLNKEINIVLADPVMKARVVDLGGTTLAGSPADFGKLIAGETEKWGKVIRAANIKAE